MRRGEGFAGAGPAVNLLLAAGLLYGTATLFERTDTIVEDAAKTAGSVGCELIDVSCPWQEEPPVFMPEGLGSGEIDVKTIVLRGLKSIDAEYTMKRTVPGTDTPIDRASSYMQGTAGFFAEVAGVVTVDYRSRGGFTVLTVNNSEPIDISGFSFQPLEPRQAGPDGKCDSPTEYEIDTGCINTHLNSGELDGIPLLGANNNNDIPTKMADIGYIYQSDQRCTYDYQIIPMITATAEKYGISLDLSGPNRFTEAAVILTKGALRKQMRQLGPPQAIVTPMTGEVAPPPDIMTTFEEMELAENGTVHAPENIDLGYCANSELISENEAEQLRNDVEVLVMYGLAPDYFDVETMSFDYENETLRNPTADELAELGVA